MPGNYVLGAGATGLAVGAVTGWPILEATNRAGGLCATYERAGYRFEPGGGHWLFRLGPRAISFLGGQMRWYERHAAAWFPEWEEFVPYPVQAQADRFPTANWLERPRQGSMKEWLLARFGPDLCAAFFWPFNETYTCGLYDLIQPQDEYKNPQQGLGYNDRFAYPVGGLGPRLERIAAGLDVCFGHRVARLDLEKREIGLVNGERLPYERLACTLPLNEAAFMAGLPVSDPATGVTVLNLGAEKGSRFPDYHWVYVVGEAFHRVGFYSNVEPGFAPPGKASLYVEMCQGHNPWQAVQTLFKWDWIGQIETWDLSEVSPAYTWRWIGSDWRGATLDALQAGGVEMLGRYGRWRFQGVAESLEEGIGFQAD